MRHLIIALLLLAPLTAQAQEADTGSDNGPLFMKDLVGDREFFAPWGVGLDFFTMDQDYDMKDLYLNVPALGGEIDIDPSQVAVTNKVQHFDVKLDAWITPFLNVFGLVGRVDADTVVDLGSVDRPRPRITACVSGELTTVRYGDWAPTWSTAPRTGLAQ